MKYKRIVFKVGTSSLTCPDGTLSRGKIQALTRQLAALHRAGHETVLVSSGAVAAGFGALGFKKRPVKIADKQASAAVGQGLLMEEYTACLSSDGIVSAQILLNRADFSDKRRYQNAAAALSVLLQRRAVPIINENDTVSVEELKIGDNDTLSAQVAAMIQADLLVLLTDIDGLYTGNPNSNPDAVRLDKIEHINHEIIAMAGGAGSANGTGGMLTKIKAATIATESGVPVYICSSLKDNALAEAAGHQADGSFFVPRAKGLRTQKQWLAFYSESRGGVYVDEGAEHALSEQGKSLLMSGVAGIEGHFSRMDTVTVYSNATKQPLGKGRVLFGSAAAEDLLKSRKAKGVFIHRDDWISITPEIRLLLTEF
ncbi:glutamate 5-kinase [Neisseria lactamica ATCC 23970]|uniref:Glutamate 5-kinase n=1 Tax=Neisseria lactamica ATCC 23970 TaxID=546265 RepID=D0W7D4_NEILA|nr:glutamate 5-kinase [Neisseria lactamica]EEZ76517.1 glutamate 5-kinase [Neisseria lactamica ATCC 23970]KFJ36577.1 glutamate 5-kinase [Neisseria lactamica ATCC 23970]VTQ47936.1 glutamate 5-kinase [Neisseria lactamica]